MIIFITALAVGIAVGMYIASQIAESIDSNTRRKQFHKDMENFNKEK